MEPDVLNLELPGKTGFDQSSGKFIETERRVVSFEHSLYTIREWEKKYKKPFLFSEKKPEEMLDYLLIMSSYKISPEEFTEEVVKSLNEYMSDSMTATTINPLDDGRGQKKVMTNEVFYAYMANARVPFECEHWHINRLQMLLGVISETNKPSKEMSKKDIMKRNAALNAQRKAALAKQGRKA